MRNPKVKSVVIEFVALHEMSVLCKVCSENDLGNMLMLSICII